ncbi:FtsX-like permease family protein [bacterium endosymbiont of Pedicinus badii]|uniref:FtsX-like permease family protein n=1 Tax=bacterium endosymbiont of Pedicinus badii TaxID=1719126 RepID=UPI0009B988CA|nr:FtsX-like permease family protein [bacterium endosymbiont of Pedicinus badii]OQM34373.1 hypothetical protein AOQ89_00575 [bacterium endosymbiont of Pedicinus badii]
MCKNYILYIIIKKLQYKKIRKSKKLVSFIFSFSIIFGVSFTIFIVSFINGFENTFEKKVLRFIPHIILKSKKEEIDKKEIFKIFNKIEKKSLLQIEKIVPLERKEIILYNKKNFFYVNLLGIEDIEKNLFFTKKFFLLKNQKNYVDNFLYISSYLSNKIRANIGEKIKFILPNFKYDSILQNFFSPKIFTISGIFETESEIDFNFVFTEKKNLKNLFGNDSTSEVYIFIKKPNEFYNLKKIKSYIPNQYIVKDWKETKSSLFNAVKLEKYTTVVLFSLVLLVSIFNIITIVLFNSLEKNREIYIFRMQGMTKKKILYIYILKEIFIGIIATLFGVLVGFLLTKNINFVLYFLNIFDKNTFLPYLINFNQIFYIAIFFIILIALSTVLSISYTINHSHSLKYLKDE